MRLLSFAWTSGAFEDGSKTVTRRDWTERYALQWRKGDLFKAVDKLRSRNARTLGAGRLTADPYRQALKDMSDEHFDREGGTRYWPDKDAFIEAMGGPERVYWVIEFERLEAYPFTEKEAQTRLPL